MKTSMILAIVVSAAIGFSGMAHAVPLNPDGTWQVLDQGTTTSPMNNGDFFTTTFTASANETVGVTDLFALGDTYNIFVNGNLVATTSSLSYTATGNGPFGYPYTPDPQTAWTTTGPYAFSHAYFSVLANQTISIQELSIPAGFPDGTVAIAGNPTPTPLPSTWVMLLGGLVSLGFLAHRGSKTAAVAV